MNASVANHFHFHVMNRLCPSIFLIMIIQLTPLLTLIVITGTFFVRLRGFLFLEHKPCLFFDMCSLQITVIPQGLIVWCATQSCVKLGVLCLTFLGLLVPNKWDAPFFWKTLDSDKGMTAERTERFIKGFWDTRGLFSFFWCRSRRNWLLLLVLRSALSKPR